METEAKRRADIQFGNQGDLEERMDIDADLVNLVNNEKQIKDANGSKIPNTVYIVLNDAAMFAWRVESALGAAIEQVSVTSENKGFDTDYVEDFIKAMFREADRLLPFKDLYALNPFIDQQTCRRGRAAVRSTLRFAEDKKTLIPDLLPMDTRYFTYWLENGGFGGTSYKTRRDRYNVLSEYPDLILPEEKERDIQVEDIWTPKYNEVYVEEQQAWQGKNIYGEVPVVFRKVPMGSMLLDYDSKKYHGESIFFLIRDLLPELNKLVSMIQTLNLREIDRALQLKKPMESIDPYEPVRGHDEVTAPGTVNVVPAEGGYEYMPVGEIRKHAELLHSMIQDRIDAATLNKLSTLVQPKTATEILQIVQDQSDLIMPRLATRGMIKKDLAEMMMKHIIKFAKGQSIIIGRNEYELGKLKGDYDIDFTYFFNDPKTDIARTSMAVSQRGLISDYSIRRTTLELQDPDGEENLMYWEQAAVESPLVRKGRMIESLLKEGEDGNMAAMYEGISMIPEYIVLAQQSMSGQMLPNGAESPKTTQPTVPLMSGQGGF